MLGKDVDFVIFLNSVLCFQYYQTANQSYAIMKYIYTLLLGVTGVAIVASVSVLIAK